jgi:hypothetical protein
MTDAWCSDERPPLSTATRKFGSIEEIALSL